MQWWKTFLAKRIFICIWSSNSLLFSALIEHDKLLDNWQGTRIYFCKQTRLYKKILPISIMRILIKSKDVLKTSSLCLKREEKFQCYNIKHTNLRCKSFFTMTVQNSFVRNVFKSSGIYIHITWENTPNEFWALCTSQIDNKNTDMQLNPNFMRMQYLIKKLHKSNHHLYCGFPLTWWQETWKC